MNDEQHKEILRRKIVHALEAIACNPCCAEYPGVGELVRDASETSRAGPDNLLCPADGDGASMD